MIILNTAQRILTKYKSIDFCRFHSQHLFSWNILLREEIILVQKNNGVSTLATHISSFCVTGLHFQSELKLGQQHGLLLSTMALSEQAKFRKNNQRKMMFKYVVYTTLINHETARVYDVNKMDMNTISNTFTYRRETIYQHRGIAMVLST